jgi:hypothetical protein
LTIRRKWLAALKEITPLVTRAAVIINPDNPGAGGFLGVIEATASSLGIRVSPVVLRSALDPERAVMERAVEAFARQSNGGMIVLPDFAATSARQSIRRVGRPKSLADGLSVPLLRNDWRAVVLRY